MLAVVIWTVCAVFVTILVTFVVGDVSSARRAKVERLESRLRALEAVCFTPKKVRRPRRVDVH